ncbi:MAG: MFS transporter [Solirubrobacteraceae bacterium]
MPSVGSMVRARRSALFDDDALLHGALALESVIDECVLIIGPAAIALIASSLTATAGLLAITVLAVTGLAGLATQRNTQPVAVGTGRSVHGRLFTRPGVWALLLTFVTIGAATSTIELATVAFCQAHHDKVLSGPVLSLLALASARAGLSYGTRGPASHTEARLLRSVQLFTAATLLLVAAPNVPGLIIAALVVGATLSPVAINGFATIRRLIPAPQLTEGFTWLTSALGLGIATGNALAGQIVAAWGTHAAFAAATACALAASLATRRASHNRPATTK